MSLLDRLERRFGFLGIPGLIRIVIGFTALVYVLVYLNRGFESFLTLDPALILRGQVWRLVTYIFIPQTFSPLWVLLALWFLWFIGEGLERAWGPFRLTLYFVIGMVGTTVTSLFFAFARFYPDEVIYILFILPVKIKWLAWVYAAFLMLGFFLGPNSYRAALIAAFINYFIFFGPEIIHQARHRRDVSTRRRRFEDQSRSSTETLHRCTACGATELSDPNLDFRVARDGEEYCMAHLPKTQTPAG
jgi:membrane associated rhomboid family serine protease